MKPPPYPIPGAPAPSRAPRPAASSQVSDSRLSEFGVLMREAGLSVDLHRMRLDRLYAYERMARAQSSLNRRLRCAGVTLFVDFEHRLANGPLH